jgi:catechol 2,3-dioxygenase-like lactoylglutathione lyase family enzyme
MILYTTLGTNDLARAKRFYDPLMATLNVICAANNEIEVGYGTSEKPDQCFIYIVKPYLNYAASWGNGTMIAFNASSRAQVDAFYKAALANGGQDDGAPGLRPFGENFYACYVRDPDGNKLSAVCKG